jgi:perosamine synthetase
MKQKKTKTTRRDFIKKASATAATATTLAWASGRSVSAAEKKETLAIDGGVKAVTAQSAWRWPLYGKQEEDAMVALTKAPGYGPWHKLEEEWKTFTGSPYSRAHCNGTAALTGFYFALSAELPPGSEIMVPSYTFFATIVPMRLFGFVPVFVDIDPQTLNFDLEDAKRKLTKNTRAIVPVHWIGLPAPMDAICDWAKEKGLIVVEDSCHAQGAKLGGKRMGTWGRMGAYSFQCSKALPGIEGGIACYQNRADYDRATAYGFYGKCEGDYAKYNGSGLGVKSRIHPMAAELVRVQLKGLDKRNSDGVKRTRAINDRLMQLPGLLEQTYDHPNMERIHYAWNMLFLDEKKAGFSRAAVVKALQAEGVKTSALGYTLQHELPLYKEAKWWHHAPTIPTKEQMAGTYKANEWALPLPYFTEDCPELTEQYVKAFEKVWVHRDQLAKMG